MVDWPAEMQRMIAGTAPGTTLCGPKPPRDDRTEPDDKAPDWLHPTLTGLEHAAFTELLTAVEQYLLDHPPTSLHHKRAVHGTITKNWVSCS